MRRSTAPGPSLRTPTTRSRRSKRARRHIRRPRTWPRRTRGARDRRGSPNNTTRLPGLGCAIPPRPIPAWRRPIRQRHVSRPSHDSLHGRTSSSSGATHRCVVRHLWCAANLRLARRPSCTAGSIVPLIRHRSPRTAFETSPSKGLSRRGRSLRRDIGRRRLSTPNGACRRQAPNAPWGRAGTR